MKPIKNREVAGKLLAERLKKRKWKNTCVLAIPRGGVPVGSVIAKELKLSFDVILVKKIGAPEQPEFAIGAICEDDKPIWNKDSVAMLNLQKDVMIELAEKTYKKIFEQTKKWRADRLPLALKDQTVILVDDGLATGLTMLAAVEYLKRKQVNKIVIAIPVASRSAIENLENLVDQILVLEIPEPFFAISQWYENFSQVTDETVTQILAEHLQKSEPLEFQI
jgi:putative phosphoribosyl transferase